MRDFDRYSLKLSKEISAKQLNYGDEDGVRANEIGFGSYIGEFEVGDPYPKANLTPYKFINNEKVWFLFGDYLVNGNESYVIIPQNLFDTLYEKQSEVIKVNDYIRGNEYYGLYVKEVNGWVDTIHFNDKGDITHIDIQADDSWKGERGTTIRTELGEIIKLANKDRPLRYI